MSSCGCDVMSHVLYVVCCVSPRGQYTEVGAVHLKRVIKRFLSDQAKGCLCSVNITLYVWHCKPMRCYHLF